MRNVWILTLAQAFAACGTIVLVTFGGIVGARIAPTPTLATLPLSLSVLGVALATLPAAMVMQRLGRKPVFVASALFSAAAALLVGWATASSQFVLLCLGATLIGAGQAFVLHYRFAATEFVPDESAGRAIATVMLGTLVAAVLGPEVGERARLLGGWVEFTGSFVALAGLFLVAASILSTLGPSAHRTSHASAPTRPVREIAAQPAFVVAVLAGVISYAVMSFIMTATPISMHVIDGRSVEETKSVITAHVLAMYLPSLISGWLTRLIGIRWMMIAGVALMTTCIAIAAFVGQHFVHYVSALVLLGAGWNLLFVAGTTLLTRTYTTAERFKVQGFNDFTIFGTQALVSLLAGTAIYAIGWRALNLAGLPLLALMAGVVLWLTRIRNAEVRGSTARVRPSRERDAVPEAASE